VGYTKDPRVDDYIDGLPPWQQRICQQVQPYFVLDGMFRQIIANNRAGGWRKIKR
jgi:hypothetical protein